MSTNPAVPRVKRRVLLASTAGAAAAAGGIGVWAAQTANAESGPQPTSGGDAVPFQGGVQGWASQNGGVSGGSQEISVSSAEEFLSAIGEGGLIVRLSGSISISGMNDVASDTTVIGDSGARITGGGLDISGQSNVIITNLTFDDWDDDAINVQESSTNIWIHHNTFGVGYDGCVDIKRESDFVTVAWNRFDGHDKNMLLGHSDDHTEDIGHLRVTYHHNFFNGTNQRNPRVRFGEGVHVVNNYYRDIGSYGVATTMDAGVILEANYFENVEDPVHIGEGDSEDGRLVAIDNHLVDSGEILENGSVSTSLPYSFAVDDASQVASIVSGGAGAN
ncbi:pectate lyase family protein [Glycomyces arizonensis]|uniref:pectate lyase family protein n=1 Tax=Glycomyces arizonensis TaxID=256035 RepID=UPI0003FE46F7|nr:pectate lyase [Glycomyces arizonensis]